MTLEIIADNAGAAAASVGALYFDTDGDPVQRTAEGWRRGLLWYFAAGSLQQPRWEPLADQLPRCYPWRPAATGQPSDLSIEVATRLCIGAEGFPLDRVARLLGCERQPGETDETLRKRCARDPAAPPAAVGDVVAWDDAPDRSVCEVVERRDYGVALRWGDFGTWISSRGVLGTDIVSGCKSWQWGRAGRSRAKVLAVDVPPEVARSPDALRRLLERAAPPPQVGEETEVGKLPVGAVAHVVRGDGAECELILVRPADPSYLTATSGEVWEGEGGLGHPHPSRRVRVVALDAPTGGTALDAVRAILPTLQARGLDLRESHKGRDLAGFRLVRPTPAKPAAPAPAAAPASQVKVGDDVAIADLPVGGVARDASPDALAGDIALRREPGAGADGCYFVALHKDEVEPYASGRGAPVEPGPSRRWRVLALGVPPDASPADALRAAGALAAPEEVLLREWRTLAAMLDARVEPVFAGAEPSHPSPLSQIEAEALPLLGGGEVVVGAAERRPWLIVGAYGGPPLARRLGAGPSLAWATALVARLRAAVDRPAMCLREVLGVDGFMVDGEWTWDAAPFRGVNARDGSTWALRTPGGTRSGSTSGLSDAARKLLGAVLAASLRSDGRLLRAPPVCDRPCIAHPRAVPPRWTAYAAVDEGAPSIVEAARMRAACARIARHARVPRPILITTIDLLEAERSAAP